jgi:diguanylate cyclase (GGDEF)-like protein
MKLGRRATYLVRRFARATGGVASASAACAAVGAGLLPDLLHAHTPPTAADVALLTLLTAIVGGAIVSRLRFTAPSARAQRVSRLLAWSPALIDVEVGLALVAGGYALVALTGGASSPLMPLVYLLVAFAATFLNRAAVVCSLCAALALEATDVFLHAHPLLTAVEHAAYLLAAVAVHALFLRGLVARQRAEHKARLEREVRAMRDEARDFRLIAAALGAESRAPRTREEEERKLTEGAVETIHQSMYYTLELLKKSLDLKTAVLLWLDDAGEHLKIKELVTDSDAVVETSLAADAGALGAIVKDRLLLNLPAPKRGHVPYYAAGAEEVGAFLGVPVIEDNHLRGVLCADRPTGRTFDAQDEALLAKAAEQILRALQSERVFGAVERSKYEHERFYHASAMLGRALTLEQVMDTAFEAAQEIVEFELASIALFDKEKKKHRVCRVRVSEDAKEIVDSASLDGLEFSDNAGLTAMVVKNKHYLPAGGELREKDTPVFTRKVKLRGVESLLVLPLVCADEAVGTFTLASRKKHAFGKDAREMLGVIGNQVAVSIENAKMYRQMETMATTDGLTGLYNHRTFQERFTEMLARAERQSTKLAIILTDVDHFKKVNDTYGHPVGDIVLKKVAQVLAESIRKIDIVARYGGEEFAVILEGTDAAGAHKLAERIRTDMAKQQFQSEKGTFSVTMSLGIACMPDDGREKHVLVEHADQALYFAKHNGRNRSVTYQQFLGERANRRAS